MRLTRRERGLFVGLVLFGIAWAVFILAVKPAVDRIETLSRVIPERNEELQKLRAGSAKYIALKKGLDSIKTKIGSDEMEFKPLSFIESTTEQFGLAEKVAGMVQEVSQLDSNYCETIVQVELKDLTFKQIVDFLHKIDSSSNFLRIKSLYIKKNPSNSNSLDTAIQISTVTLNQQ